MSGWQQFWAFTVGAVCLTTAITSGAVCSARMYEAQALADDGRCFTHSNVRSGATVTVVCP